jgi:RNA polymerase sigma-70 factor (ECF subfamily)
MPQSARSSEQELLERARQGDERAFRQLVEQYEGLVAATVIGMLGPGPDAEDVGQETFLRFHRALRGFRGDSSVGTYLTRIAINQSLRALDKRKRWTARFSSRDQSEVPWDPVSPDPTADEVLRSRETAAVVQQAIRKLSPGQRAVMVLRMIDGYSTRETAEILEIPQGTVLSRLSRAMDRLKGLLTPHMDDHEEQTS